MGLREVGTQPPAVETVHNLITARRVTDMDSNYCTLCPHCGVREAGEGGGRESAIKIDGGQVRLERERERGRTLLERSN